VTPSSVVQTPLWPTGGGFGFPRCGGSGIFAGFNGGVPGRLGDLESGLDGLESPFELLSEAGKAAEREKNMTKNTWTGNCILNVQDD